MNVAKDDNPPHIFAVADQSYQTMMHNRKHQVSTVKPVLVTTSIK